MNDEESNELAARLLYFDILPAGAVSNIVRFFSASPRAEKWANYVDLANISALYDVKGELGAFMLTLCTALRLNSTHIADFPSSEIEPEEAIRCDPKDLLDSSLPKQVAESFRSFVVSYDMVYEVAQTHVDYISETFPNIRKLILGPRNVTERVWMKKLGPHIETLRCETFSTDIPKYCRDLRHLYMNKMFSYALDVNSWENSFEKLETLSVIQPLDDVNLIGFVEKFCRKIKRLELSGLDDIPIEAISKCIASYGYQLERVRLDLMTETQLLRVKSACPKARIELIVSEGLLAQTVKIVGNELEEVTVYFNGDSQENDKDLVDWSACTNIEMFRSRNHATVAFLESFMKSPKYNLRSIDLSINGELKNVKAAISLIAKGTGGLEKFKFSCNNAANGMFQELVDANRSMRNAKITLVDSARKNEIATDIVKTFMKSSSLNNLEVKDLSFPTIFGFEIDIDNIAEWRGVSGGDGGPKIAEIERICRTEGCRRVCITVFDVCYLR